LKWNCTSPHTETAHRTSPYVEHDDDIQEILKFQFVQGKLQVPLHRIEVSYCTSPHLEYGNDIQEILVKLQLVETKVHVAMHEMEMSYCTSLYAVCL